MTQTKMIAIHLTDDELKQALVSFIATKSVIASQHLDTNYWNLEFEQNTEMWIVSIDGSLEDTLQ